MFNSCKGIFGYSDHRFWEDSDITNDSQCLYNETITLISSEACGKDGTLRLLICRSLVNKAIEFETILEMHKPDVVVCTET